MTLLSWRSGRSWSQWHIADLGLPLCGTPVPDAIQGFSHRAARPRDWFHICARCRELALRRSRPAGEPQWRLSARDPRDGTFREILVVAADTHEAALAFIRASAAQSVLACSPDDYRLEPMQESIPTLTGGNP